MRALLTRPFLLGFTGAVAGALLCLLLWQAWVTYARVNALWDLEVRRAQAVAAQAPPAGS